MEWHDRIGRRLRLRDLHTFFTVAESGSMARAAAQLAVTQPAISKAIADMEHILGVRLLDRTPRGVELTLHGKALMVRGAAAFEELRHAVREMEYLSDPGAGELRLGTTLVMMSGLMTAIVTALSTQFPRLAFHIAAAQTVPLLFRDLRERNLELIMGRLAMTGSHDDLETDFLADEPVFVVVGKNSGLTRRRTLSLADLVDAPWALPMPDTIPGAYAVDAFRKAGLPFPRRLVSCNSIQMQSDLVATTEFVGLFPRSFLRFNQKRLSLKVLPIDVPVKTAPLVIVRLKNRPMSAMAQRFVKIAHQLASAAR